jgi:hypothetical protein
MRRKQVHLLGGSLNHLAFVLLRLSFGIFIFITIIYDFFHGGESFIVHFSYFTILSNLFMSLFYIYLGIWPKSVKSHVVSLIRGAILGYLIISSLVYIFILHNPNATYWVIILFHKINPTVFFVDWLLSKNEPKIKLGEIVYWFIFPFFYLAYVLLRGSISNWYPYNFLNVQANGLTSVVIYFLSITLFSIILSAVIVMLGNFREKLGISNNAQ